MKWRPLMLSVGKVSVKCKRKLKRFQVNNVISPLFEGVASGESKGESVGRG